MEKLTYFVPVDFSDCSFNALQYAIMLAGFSEGNVVIGHVIDLNEIPDSENSVVVSWGLENLARKANEKMKSLKEIISLKGVGVYHDMVMGNVRLELMKQISRVKPNVIVIGRNTNRPFRKDSMVSYITRNTRIPVLVVPGSHNPTLPNRAILATDMKPEKVTELETFFTVLKRTPQELAIVTIKGNVAEGDSQAEQWLEKIRTLYGVDATLMQQKNSKDVHVVLDFINTNKIDLLCTIRRNSNILDRLLNRHTTHQFTEMVKVPVLMINE